MQVGISRWVRFIDFRLYSDGVQVYFLKFAMTLYNYKGDGLSCLTLKRKRKGMKRSVAAHSLFAEISTCQLVCSWFVTYPWQLQIPCRSNLANNLLSWHNSIFFFSCFLCSGFSFFVLILVDFALIFQRFNKMLKSKMADPRRRSN